MAVQSAPAASAGVWRNRALFALMLGHLTNDMGVGLMPVLYPLFVERFELDLKTVGLVALAYSGLSSVAQPLFGWAADRWGVRFTGLTLLGTALAFAAIGFAPTFAAVVVLAGLSGICSGAFHPLAAVGTRVVSTPETRNAAMSFFLPGGWVGVALGPLLGAAVLGVVGTGATLLVLPGAIVVSALLLAELRGGRATESAATTLGRAGRAPLAGILAVVGVSMAQSLTVVGVYSFTPTWYRALGYDAAFYGPLATTILLASAAGTFVAGPLADRFGRRAVILAALGLLAPVLLLYAQFTGSAAFVTGAGVGFLSAALAPLLVVLTQGLVRDRAGMASGLILGLGFVTTAVGVPVFGAIADTIGLQDAMRLQAVAALATLAFAWFLPEPRTDERG